MSISIESYSEYSLVVRGDTKRFKTNLLELGGKFNSNLKDGAGWIFSKKKNKEALESLQKDISEGKIKGEESEEVTQNNPSSSSQSVSSNNSSSSQVFQSKDFVSMKTYLALLSRVEKLEQICSHSPFVEKENFVVQEEEEEKETKESVVGLLRKKKTKKAEV